MKTRREHRSPFLRWVKVRASDVLPRSWWRHARQCDHPTHTPASGKCPLTSGTNVGLAVARSDREVAVRARADHRKGGGGGRA